VSSLINKIPAADFRRADIFDALGSSATALARSKKSESGEFQQLTFFSNKEKKTSKRPLLRQTETLAGCPEEFLRNSPNM
jgi:hypothetical protein